MTSKSILKTLRKEFREVSTQYVDAGVLLNRAGLLTKDHEREMRQVLKSSHRRCEDNRGQSEETPESRLVAETDVIRKKTQQLLDQLPPDYDVEEADGLVGEIPTESASWDRLEMPPFEQRDSEGAPGTPDSKDTSPSMAVATLGEGETLATSLTSDQRRELFIAVLHPMAGTLEQRHEALCRTIRERDWPGVDATPSKPTLSRYMTFAAREGDYPPNSPLANLVISVGSTHSPDLATRGLLLLLAAYLVVISSYAVIKGAAKLSVLVDAVPFLIQARVILYGPLERVEGVIQLIEREITNVRGWISRSTGNEFWPDLPGVPLQLPDPSVSLDPEPDEDALYPSGKDFGKLAKKAALLQYGDSLPGDSQAEDKARIRALISTPVIEGDISAAEQAKIWRGKIREAFATSGQDFLEGFPREYYRRWMNLTERTVRKWSKEVEDARKNAKRAGEPVPRAETVLLHSYPANRSPTQLKRTPEIIEKVRQIYNKPAGVGATTVGRLLGHPLSTRTIQRIVAENLDEREILNQRGGSLAEQLVYDPKLIRYADKPLRLMVIDSTYIRGDLLGAVRDLPSPIDMRLSAVREVISEKGHVERVRLDHLHATLVIDGCSGMWLALRLWDRPVSADTAILTLYDAWMRYGIPDVLYSDNGSEFANQAMKRILTLAGVNEVHSIPYRPEGRGRVERPFRFLKNEIFPLLPGFRGKGGPPVATENLLTVSELESCLMEEVETHVNGTAMRGMPKHMTRRVHFDQEVGARGLRTAGAEGHALHLMNRRDDAVLHEEGIYANGLRYWADELAELINDSRVLVFSDPYRPWVVHVAINHRDGDLRYVCAAEQYGTNNPPPSIVEQRRRIAESRQRIEARSVEIRASGELKMLTKASSAKGVVAAEELVQRHIAPGLTGKCPQNEGPLLLGPGDTSGSAGPENEEPTSEGSGRAEPPWKQSRTDRPKVRLPYEE